MELPLAEAGNAAVPWLFANFVHLLLVFNTFVINIMSLQHSQATFGIKFKIKHFSEPCSGQLPSEITILELPLAA